MPQVERLFIILRTPHSLPPTHTICSDVWYFNEETNESLWTLP